MKPVRCPNPKCQSPYWDRPKGVSRVVRESQGVPVDEMPYEVVETAVKSFEEEVGEVARQLVAENPEMDEGRAKGQAMMLVKKRRQEEAVAEIREDTAAALGRVEAGKVSDTAEELRRRFANLGLKRGSEL